MSVNKSNAVEKQTYNHDPSQQLNNEFNKDIVDMQEIQ
jgi:hypothetical protein